MRILFLTDNFPPESNAPATRTYEHCVEWLKKGAKVTVITCVPNYPKGEVFPGYKNRLYQTEMVDGIKVIRVWSYITPNRGLLRRILDYFSFCISAFIASLFIKTDIIIATSPQLFTAVAGYLASLFKQKPWIMEVRDLWPESIKAVGAMKESKVIKLLDQLVLFLYKKATNIVVVTDAFKERMISLGIDGDKVKVVKNGVHTYKFQPREKDQLLLDKLALNDKFIIAYIGTHGMAHKLDFILDSVQKIKNEKIYFLFLGDGAFKTRLVYQAKSLGLTNVSLLDSVPKSEVARYISIADVALITLRKKNTFTKVIPSKIFENAAMLKPILLGVEGEAKEIIESYNVGICFEPENENDFLQKVDEIYSDQVSYQTFKNNCPELVSAFDRKKLALKMYSYIEVLVPYSDGKKHARTTS